MIARLCGAWPSLDLARAGEVYADEFVDMAQRFGRSVVENGLTAAIRDTNRSNPAFAPSATELRNYVLTAATGTVQRRTCPMCADNEGWVAEIYDEVERRKKCVSIHDIGMPKPDTYRLKRCDHKGRHELTAKD